MAEIVKGLEREYINKDRNIPEHYSDILFDLSDREKDIFCANIIRFSSSPKNIRLMDILLNLAISSGILKVEKILDFDWIWRHKTEDNKRAVCRDVGMDIEDCEEIMGALYNDVIESVPALKNIRRMRRRIVQGLADELVGSEVGGLISQFYFKRKLKSRRPKKSRSKRSPKKSRSKRSPKKSR